MQKLSKSGNSAIHYFVDTCSFLSTHFTSCYPHAPAKRQPRRSSSLHAIASSVGCTRARIASIGRRRHGSEEVYPTGNIRVPDEGAHKESSCPRSCQWRLEWKLVFCQNTKISQVLIPPLRGLRTGAMTLSWRRHQGS